MIHWIVLAMSLMPVWAENVPAWKQAFKDDFCARKTEEFLRNLGADLKRSNGPRTGADFSEVWDFPTDQIGSWVHLKLQYELPVAVLAISQGKQKGFILESSCRWTEVLSGPLDSSARENSFTDKDLGNLLDAKSNTMIYLWSPRQVYSMKYWKTFARVANAFHLSFKPLVVPPVSDAEVTDVRRRFQLPLSFMTENRSYELYARGMQSHTPSALIIRRGKITPRLLVGAYTEPALKNAVATQVGER